MGVVENLFLGVPLEDLALLGILHHGVELFAVFVIEDLVEVDDIGVMQILVNLQFSVDFLQEANILGG